MKKTLVYDWPTRLFHWLFAFLFLAAFIIAETVDDDSSFFSYHMLAGLTIVFLLVFRIIWGFMGTAYARFSSFKVSPAELSQYMKDAVMAKTKRYLGHNPASSYAAILMFISAIGLAVTGLLMTSVGETDFYEESHEIMANIFLIAVIAHLAGIVFHHFKHKDALWSSMMDGKKKALPGKKGIANFKPIAGIIFIIITSLWFSYLGAQYDRDTQILDLFGTELKLGEEEHE
ncbi:MAG: cytochrome b/b6 domain-containing protein [Balneolaceae bacterium]